MDIKYLHLILYTQYLHKDSYSISVWPVNPLLLPIRLRESSTVSVTICWLCDTKVKVLNLSTISVVWWNFDPFSSRCLALCDLVQILCLKLLQKVLFCSINYITYNDAKVTTIKGVIIAINKLNNATPTVLMFIG